MTIHPAPHQCPKCELRFTWPTELDDHCRSEHPEFHHDYPVRGGAARAEPEAQPAPRPRVRRRARRAEDGRTSAILATWWTER